MSSPQQTRVVVTGMGTTSPLGGNVADTWQALLAGTPGARPMPYDWVQTYDLPVTFAATLAQPASEVLSKVEQRRQDPCSQYALIAAREDVADMANTSAASVPLAVTRLLREGRAKSGDICLQFGFGAGLTWAAQVVVLP